MMMNLGKIFPKKVNDNWKWTSFNIYKRTELCNIKLREKIDAISQLIAPSMLLMTKSFYRKHHWKWQHLKIYWKEETGKQKYIGWV